MPTARKREIAVTLPALCLVSCLPTSDLAAYSEARDDSLLGVPRGAAGNPPMTQPGTGGEGMLPPELVQSPLADAGTAGALTADAAADAGSVSPCGVSRSLGPNGDCYLVETTTRSWSEARADCQSRGDGWDLASIGSAEESAFLAQLVTIEAWISASDAQTEGTWTWGNGDVFWSGTGTGNAVNGAYSNWNSDEPNGAEESDCARLLPRMPTLPDRNAPWADVECSLLRGALCQGPLG